MKTPIILLLLSALPALATAAGNHQGGHAMHGDQQASAVGTPGKAADVTRTVEIKMNDSMRFVPDAITVKAGETIRFFIRNTGKVPHEMVIGSMTELKEHAEMMRNMPGMQHDEPNMITLKPGQRGGLVWKFDQPGSVDFACLVPGHLEAGMAGKVMVSK
ncbi:MULTISPECIES: cupredoxin family protein [Candidatus Accumulibacter]|jgi:uncharacterized cupredoxin-like copper-binding protein|uniref:cupredoxin domain-containing protein n=1 Tax=Candidatus Accumulibacter TaxID=327159 RepID=UPI0025C33066|nr:cupredoxin family protein [Candidatus Accumulibacter sp. ACC007]